MQDKEGHVGRLHILMRECTERIDELTATIDQLREQNRRLDQECEHLAAMVKHQPTPADRLDTASAR